MFPTPLNFLLYKRLQLKRSKLLALVFGHQKEDSLILLNVLSDIWFRTAVKFLTVVFFMFFALQSWPTGTFRLLQKRKKNAKTN